MSNKMRTVRPQRELEAVLRETGIPYTIERGKKHRKIIMAGRQIGVFSHNAMDGGGKRGLSNIIASIKREAKRLQHA